MALRAMHSAATGMQAHQFKLDTIANNLANASTTSFKNSRANFEDLFYQHKQLPGAQVADGETAVGISVGLGTRISSTSLDFSQGPLVDSNDDLHVAIQGDGFFEVSNQGVPAYTRAGNFTRNANGDLVLGTASNSVLLQPAINIPQEATSISISGDGGVSYLADGETVPVGRLQLVRFANNNGLLQLGNNLYQETPASGPAQNGQPSELGFGSISHHKLEGSNVEPVTELVDLIKTQRNFELNSQTIQAADQMLQLISNLRRF